MAVSGWSVSKAIRADIIVQRVEQEMRIPAGCADSSASLACTALPLPQVAGGIRVQRPFYFAWLGALPTVVSGKGIGADEYPFGRFIKLPPLAARGVPGTYIPTDVRTAVMQIDQ